MTAWLDHDVSDFLLFSADVYWRLFALENAALFPWTILAPAAALGALVIRHWRPEAGVRTLCVVLAASWAVTGANFLWERYAAINWAAPYAAPLFMVATLALLVCGLQRAPERLGRHAIIGVFLVMFGLAVHPLSAWAFGRDLMTAELVGVAPDPTAAATLGAAFLMPSGALRIAVGLAAAIWLAISATTLWALGQPEFWLPVIALVTCAIGGGLASGRAREN